jgi:hypothetical protein
MKNLARSPRYSYLALSSKRHSFASLLLICAALHFDANASPSLSSSDSSKPEIVSGTGIDEEDAIRKALRLAVSQRCGESLRATTIESNTYNKSRAADTDANIVSSDTVDVSKRSQLAATTGGVIKTFQVLSSGNEGEKRHSVTLQVFIEKCLVEDSGRITLRSQRRDSPRSKDRVKVDPKAVVERNISVIVRYSTPSKPVDSTTLQQLVTATAKDFALNIAKSNVLQQPYRLAADAQVRNEIVVRDLSVQTGAVQLSAAIALFGVNAELDGTTLGAEFIADSGTTLELTSRFSEELGISFFENKKDGNLIVIQAEKTGAAFGKLIRGDIIEKINSVLLRDVDDAEGFLKSSFEAGPMKVSIRRGSMTALVVLR